MPLLQSALMWSRSAILGGWFGFAPGVDPCPNDPAPYDRRRPTLAYPDTPVDPVLPGLQVLHVMLKRSSRAAGSTQKPLMISAAQPCMHTAVALTVAQSVSLLQLWAQTMLASCPMQSPPPEQGLLVPTA